jgi:hypothetical protein
MSVVPGIIVAMSNPPTAGANTRPALEPSFLTEVPAVVDLQAGQR